MASMATNTKKKKKKRKTPLRMRRRMTKDFWPQKR
jgi:hypothetical protein